MEKKTDALMIRSVDYRDNDKILTLFSAEEGKITANIKGVRKNGAKLRFAAEPFTFAEYVYAEKSGRKTIVSASLYDGFFSLREDVTCYYAACAVCQLVDKILPEGIADPAFFLDTVTAIKEICYGKTSQAMTIFLLKALRFSGFAVDLTACGSCGGSLEGYEKLYFDFSTGRFSCPECGEGVPSKACTYAYLKKCAALPYDEGLLAPDAPKRAVRLLKTYFCSRTETELSSLSEYLAIMEEE